MRPQCLTIYRPSIFFLGSRPLSIYSEAPHPPKEWLHNQRLIRPQTTVATCLRYMVSAGIIERKLRRTKVRLFTVPCCSIILFSSEGMKKNVSDLPPNFFRCSIILVGALLFYNSVFPHFSHISHFRSIINFPQTPFYN